MAGRINPGRAEWFGDLILAVEQAPQGVTITVHWGLIPYRATLFGIMNRIRDLGLKLTSITTIEPPLNTGGPYPFELGGLSMNDKVCMITGANSGIGRATALGLAGMGATAVMVCRNRDLGQAAAQEIRAQSGNQRVELLVADLSSQAAIRSLAANFKARYSRLDVLINNAGIAPVRRSVTVDGIESVFAVNYLAPFLLTNLLLEALKASAPARVVNVAGDFHRKATIQFDDLMSEKAYTGVRANNQAKLALILFTYELARRLAGTGVTANCLHPGATATDGPLNDPDLPAFSRTMYRLVRAFFQSPERGAETSIYLASSPDVDGVTGKYFIKKRAVASSPESYDVAIAQRLWEVSSQLTGLAPDLARRNA